MLAFWHTRCGGQRPNVTPSLSELKSSHRTRIDQVVKRKHAIYTLCSHSDLSTLLAPGSTRTLSTHPIQPNPSLFPHHPLLSMHLPNNIFYILATLSTSSLTIANPVPEAAANGISPRDNSPLLLDKRACQTIETWKGGGCSVRWGSNRCTNRCKDAAAGKGCCSGTVTSSVLSNPGCFSGFKVCGCGCLVNP